MYGWKDGEQGTRGSLRRGRPCIHPDPPAARSVAHTPPTPPPSPRWAFHQKNPWRRGARRRDGERNRKIGDGGGRGDGHLSLSTPVGRVLRGGVGYPPAAKQQREASSLPGRRVGTHPASPPLVESARREGRGGGKRGEGEGPGPPPLRPSRPARLLYHPPTPPQPPPRGEPAVEKWMRDRGTVVRFGSRRSPPSAHPHQPPGGGHRNHRVVSGNAPPGAPRVAVRAAAGDGDWWLVVMMAEKPVDESRWWRERGNGEQGGTGMGRGRGGGKGEEGRGRVGRRGRGLRRSRRGGAEEGGARVHVSMCESARDAMGGEGGRGGGGWCGVAVG